MQLIPVSPAKNGHRNLGEWSLIPDYVIFCRETWRELLMCNFSEQQVSFSYFLKTYLFFIVLFSITSYPPHALCHLHPAPPRHSHNTGHLYSRAEGLPSGVVLEKARVTSPVLRS